MSCKARKSNIFGISNGVIQPSFLREIIKPSLKRVHKVGRPIDFYGMINPYAFIALLDDPTYTKALERRASSNDTINTWTSLTAAQEGDYDPSD